MRVTDRAATGVARMTQQWYGAMALVALFGAHTLTTWDVLPGLVLAGLLLFTFTRGLRRTRPRPATVALPAAAAEAHLSRFLPYMALASIALTLYISRFYTGNTVSSVVSSLSDGTSLYYAYQAHFAEANIGTFSLQKVLPILATMVMKFTLITLFVKLFIVEETVTTRLAVSLALVSGGYLYFSFSRGTSFEIFELFVLVWFAMTMRRLVRPRDRGSRLGVPAAAVVGGGLFLYVFNFNQQARFGFNYTRECLTVEICRDADSFLLESVPLLGELTFRMATYAAFGVHFTSQLLEELVRSPELLLASMVPMGFAIVGVDSREALCRSVIDCGAAWTPDMVLHMETFGVIGLFAGVWLIGIMARRLLVTTSVRPDSITLILLYFIVLSMLSLPMGNFVSVSSSNRLSLLLAGTLYVLARRRHCVGDGRPESAGVHGIS